MKEREGKVSFMASILGGFFALKGKLPLGYHYFWGRVVSWVLEKVLHYRRDVVIVNLSRSFPEKKYHEISAIAHEFYLHVGRLFAETVWLAGCRGERGRKRIHRVMPVRYADCAAINAQFGPAPSLFLFNSHLGNWDLLGGFPCYCYDPENPLLIKPEHIVVVYKKQSSRVWDEVFGLIRCGAMRGTGFNGYVESSGILRYMITHRSDKKIYIFNADQYPYYNAVGKDLPSFLNQPTKVMTGGIALARKMSLPVSYLRKERDADGRYVWSFVPICADASEMDENEIIARYYALLEEDIRKDPAQYLWSHKRWK